MVLSRVIALIPELLEVAERIPNISLSVHLEEKTIGIKENLFVST